MKRVAVIGAGASGVAAALTASKYANEVTLIEAGSRICRKISVSGNGRCNISNANVSKQFYNDSKIVESIINKYNYNVIWNQLQEWGLMLSQSDEEGRIYPITFNSNTVIEVFNQRISQSNIQLKCNCLATEIKKSGNQYIISTSQGEIYADKIAISVGSGAQAKLYNASQLIDSKYFTNLSPSLTSIKVKDCSKSLHGQRLNCKATLLCNNQIVASEFGEVMLKHNELSGIVIFNLSAFIARNIVKGIKAKYTVSLDLFSQYSVYQLQEIIDGRINQFGNKSSSIYSGMLNSKMFDIFGNTKDAAKKLKNWSFEVTELSGLAQAQVVAGGIDDKYINDDLSLVYDSNIFVCGEVLNVDGLCGGFNLHFAIASGLCVGHAIK